MKHKTALLTLAAASVLCSFSGVGAKCMSWNGFAIAGMRSLIAAANAILLQFTAPVYSAVIGRFVLHERVTRRDVASIALMFAGLVLLLYDGLTSGRMLGNVLALLSGVCSGAVILRAMLLHLLGHRTKHPAMSG